jgi:hypothetical protein
MANEVGNNAINAALAYRSAVEDYGNFIDNTMRQFGWQTKGTDGGYSTLNAQNAFDPDRIVQFDSTGSPYVDTNAIIQATSEGQYGTTGAFAQAAQQGASQEAQAALQGRMGGFGKGSGLMSQQRQLAEAATKGQMSNLSSQFASGLFSKYANLGKQYQNVAAGQAQDTASSAARRALMSSLYNM